MALSQRNIELLTEFAQTTPALATNIELLTEFRSAAFSNVREPSALTRTIENMFSVVRFAD